jgi:carbamoyl-phosphate synthase small subunit
MKARIILEDGFSLQGTHFGAPVERTGEVVFNTSMTGYQEILTDPSYAGQIVIMTHPHIGNYGITASYSEAERPYVQGFAAREFSKIPSHWRSEESLDDFMTKHSIPGISGIDSRSLVRRIRTFGAIRGMITVSDESEQVLLERVLKSEKMTGLDLVRRIEQTGFRVYDALPAPDEPTFHIVAYNFGIKMNILRSLISVGFKVTVVPASLPAEELIKLEPDGIFLSNGPGDPSAVRYGIKNVKKLIDVAPIFGICLGHQILALSLGAKTYKLKFGHRGGNQPVKNLSTNKVEITSHNHGFSVDADTLNDSEIEISHINLNDNTLEGFRLKNYPVFCVQYHPEAAPGPQDSAYLFQDFYNLVKEHKR